MPYAAYSAFHDETKDADKEQVLSWLEKSGLSLKQKQALFAGKGWAGNYGQWEQARQELADDPLYRQLNLTDMKKVQQLCLEHGTGDKDYSKADAALLAGWSLGQYYTIQVAVDNFEADKKPDGSTVSGSKKEKVLEYLNESGLSLGQQGMFLLLTENWRLEEEMIRAAARHIVETAERREELEEMAELCGFAINQDGSLRYVGKDQLRQERRAKEAAYQQAIKEAQGRR